LTNVRWERAPRHKVRSAAAALTAVAGLTALSACGGGASGAGSSSPVGSTHGSGGTLVIGMTAGAIPPLDTELSGSQGYEGYRFVGNQLYDGLTRFDLLQSTQVPTVVPDLATSWTAAANATSWTFTLRPGVTFSDGTPFNADAVIFNVRRDFDHTFQYYDAAVGALAATLSPISSWQKVGDMTVRLTLKNPDSHLPSDLTTLYFASPTAIQKDGNIGFGSHPVGTGPFVYESEITGQELVLDPNPHYWAGAPKLSKLILKPIPDASARIAALRSGEVNWIEYPTPDDISALKGAGFQIEQNTYDHIWPWLFNLDAKPWNNVKVRQAANYAINRQAMATDLLHGTAVPAYQLIPPANSAYSASNFAYSYDPAKAKQLLAEAGYPNGVSATISYPTSGSGNMIPGPMNEELQQDLAAVGIHVTLQPMEWATMLTQFETGHVPGGSSATNISLSFQQEDIWAALFLGGSPINVSHYNNPKVNSLLMQAQTVVDPVARAKIYSEAGNLISQDAPWLFVVNDENPRALAPSVHGFIEPKSWFVNLTTVWVG
jgi:peptide/nickel transport system substrate-binding protein